MADGWGCVCVALYDQAKSSQQSKLKDRLAAKKQAKEAELRAKEEALKQELAEKQRQQVSG